MASVRVVSLLRLKPHPLISGSSANAAEEFFVRKSPLYEVLGQLGMWGTLINGVQAGSLEYKGIRDISWNGQIGEFCSTPSRFHALNTCSKPVCCWLIPLRCSSCIRQPQSSIDWQALYFTTSICSLQTFSVSCSVRNLYFSPGHNCLIDISGLFLYVRPVLIGAPDFGVTGWVRSTSGHFGCTLWRLPS